MNSNQVRVFVFASILLVGCSTMTKRELDPARTICTGRFLVEAPIEWKLSGRAQESYLSGLSDATDFATLLRPSEKKLLKRKTVHGDLWIVGRSIETIDRVGLANFEEGNRWLSMRTNIAKGKEDIFVDAAEKIFALYRDNSREGFCLENGSITGERSRFERSSLVFSKAKNNLVFIGQPFSKEADADPFAGPITRFQLWISDVGTTVYRDRARQVAGRRGREVILEIVDKKLNTRTVQFKFFAAGDITVSSIEIKLETAPEEREEHEPTWDAFLDSIQPNS